MILCIIWFLPSRALADEPLCGVYSVYSAALLLGRDLQFEQLLRPEFISSPKGSSLEDLERAVGGLGLHSLALTNLTTTHLYWIDQPTILRVRTNISSSEYDHYVLFGGLREDRHAMIYDGARQPVTLTLGQIANRWDGNALVISDRPINMEQIRAPTRWRNVLWIACIGAVWACARIWGKPARQTHWLTASLLQASVVCMIAIMLSVIWHSSAADGFLAAPEAVREVKAAHAASFLERISLSTARELQPRQDVVFVDSRPAERFAAGHISGAVNIPATISESEAARLGATLPSNRRLVVYCDNERCHFSAVTAQRLLNAGYKDVVIFPAGWAAWQNPEDQVGQ